MTFSMDGSTLYLGSRPIATIDYAARYRAALMRYSPVVAEHIAANGELSWMAAVALARQMRVLI